MLVPAILFGSYADARKQCRKALLEWLRERSSLVDALERGGMVATEDVPGPLTLEGPAPGSSKLPQFQFYVPLRILIERTLDPLIPDTQEAVFSSLLVKPWSILCTLSSNNMVLWFFDEDLERYRRYVEGMLRHWDDLEAEGARYSVGSTVGRSLWDAARPVTLALMRIGVPRELTKYGAPPPPGGLAAAVARADPKLAGGLVDLATAIVANANRPVRRKRSDVPPPSYPQAVAGQPVLASSEMAAAMRANDPEAVRRLIAAGEPIDSVNMHSLRSPLLWAAERGHAQLVECLLDLGADIEDRADEGESPLMLAASHGQPETVRLLLKRGADPLYVTDKGFDSLLFAEMSENNQVISILASVLGGMRRGPRALEPDEE